MNEGWGLPPKEAPGARRFGAKRDSEREREGERLRVQEVLCGDRALLPPFSQNPVVYL